MKAIAIIVLTLTSIAACGQTSKPSKSGWIKFVTKDAITEVETTGYAVQSELPEHSDLLIGCRDGKHYTPALFTNFQVHIDDLSDSQVIVPMRIDNVPLKMGYNGAVFGDRLNQAWLFSTVEIVAATTEIKMQVSEYAGNTHILTFKLHGAVPDCPTEAK